MTLRRPAANLTDTDLRSHLRALSGQRPAPGFGPTFPDRIRDGARRRRTNSRIATAFVLILVVVGIPLGALATTGRGTDTGTPTAATPTAAPTSITPTSTTPPTPAYSYGGITATWLPAGMTHTVDNAVVPDTSPQQGPLGPIRLYRRDVATPLLTIQGVPLGPGEFLSQFTGPPHPPATPVPTATRTVPSPTGFAAPPGPDLLWITIAWAPPGAGGLTPLTTAMKRNSPNGKITTAAKTVNGRPALLATVDTPGLPDWFPGEGTYNHDAMLAWATPSGAVVTVESATADPTDLAALQRVADGVTVTTRPPNPTAPPAPDAATMSAVLTAIHNAFSTGVNADRFAAAVQGGDALTATHTALLAINPRLGPQIEPPTDAEAGRIELIDPDTVTAVFNLITQNVTDYANAVIVHTAAGWQVSRDTYCHTIATTGITPTCPPA